jgi:hypothetical protein
MQLGPATCLVVRLAPIPASIGHRVGLLSFPPDHERTTATTRDLEGRRVADQPSLILCAVADMSGTRAKAKRDGPQGREPSS